MDIYKALHSDHEHLRKMLEQLEHATEMNKETSELLTRVRDVLIPHSRAEEELFYNCIRQLDPDNGVIMHSYREHMEAETLLRALQGMAMVGIEWTAAARKLRESVTHHIEDEEKKVFPVAKKLFDKEEAEQIGKAFIAMKPQVREEGMLANSMHLIRNLMPARLRGESAREESEQPKRPKSRHSA